MQPQPPPPLLHALHNRPNLSNNNASLGPMKQQVTFEIDGRPSLGGGEEILTEDEARRRREQLNRRPSYRQILKDLETVGDKPIKREMLEDPSTHHLRGGLNGAGRSLGVNGHVDGGHSSYGSPLSTSDGPTGDEPPAATPPPTQTAVLTAPPPQLSSANPLLSAAVAASLMLPGTVAGTISSSGDLIGGLKPLSAAVAGGGGASTMDAADALSAAVSAAAVSSAFSHGNDWNGLDWKNSLLYSNHQSAGPPLIGGGGAGVGLVQANTPGSITSSHSDNDDNNRKRQVRLLKNREAAKECRRKKKEYVKCLENRVGVLENQNKALIEELKTLKELYCRKEKSELP